MKTRRVSKHQATIRDYDMRGVHFVYWPSDIVRLPRKVEPWVGKVRDIRKWNYTLSAEEITRLADV